MENQSHSEDIDIEKYLLVIKRRWLIVAGVFIACTGLAVARILSQKTTYDATGQLLFQTDRTSSLTKVGEKIGELDAIKRESNPLDTQAAFMQSLPVRQDVVNILKQKDPKAATLSAEQLSLEIKGVVATDVMNVTYTSSDPQLAAEVVNQLMKSYITKNIEANRTQAVTAGNFIQDQLPRAKAESDKAAEELRQFKAHNQVIELTKETSATVELMRDLAKDLNQAKAELANTKSQEIQIGKQLNLPEEKAVEISSLNQIAGVQDTIAELQKVQTQLAHLGSLYTDKNPSVLNLKEQEIALNNLLQQRINQHLQYKTNISPGDLQIGQIKQNLIAQFVDLQSKRLGLEKQVESLSQIQNSYKQKSTVFPYLEKIQGELDRKLDVSQKSYENLLTRLQETKLAESQAVGDAMIIEPAIISKSQKASRLKFFMLVGGVFIGLLAGIGTAFFVDVIDRRLKSVKEAERFFGYTLLGMIPKFEINNTSVPSDSLLEAVSRRVIVTTSPRSIIHEAYQMLQANLKFISHKKVRTIVVTSSVVGEGKSEVSANIAAVLAQVGRRVLIIDADLRQPSQHHLWGLINSVGLSNVIVGQDEIAASIQEVTSNISVMTAGVIPPNPIALIDSERMNYVIETLSLKYDYIVFDTPPLAGTADAAVLGKMVDGVLLVVRPGVLDSASAAAAKSLLTRSEANVLGLVANAVNLKHEPDGYFYYSSHRSEHSVEKVGAV